MTDLDKAREWANRGENLIGVIHPDAEAAIEIIQSLPDQWVDVEKVREVTDRHNDLIVDFLDQFVGDMHTDTWEAIRDFMCELNVEVDALAIPKLPTLADMTQEEREACQWMQADVKLSGEGSMTCVIADPRNPGAKVRVWAPHGGSDDIEAGRVTPLPDLPKLKWPGGVVDCEIVDETPADQQPNSSETPKSSIKPEDVPADELWLVEFDGNEWVGKRNRGDEDTFTWRVASLGIKGSGMAEDSDMTLIHKLVPETHALPEGMRLADHAEYGRVVVSPKDDLDGDYQVFCSQDQTEYGASWWYAHKSELTFLDGDQHV